MKLNEIGEIGLIERIKKKISITDSEVMAGIGDDAAVIKSGGKNLTLLTADMLIENVHFTVGKMSFSQIGHKALAVNLSDIAAMGGLPRFCLVNLGLPKEPKDSVPSVEDVDEIYKGILSLAEEYQVKVVGGDTNFSPSGLIIDICVLGEVEPESLCLRSSACVGDSVLVTGKLGGAAANLAKGEYIPPTPRIKEARAILKMTKIHAMVDLSDGLARDLHAVANSSKLGALLYTKAIPVSAGATIEMALGGGEEFELLFTVPAHEVDKLLTEIPKKTGTVLTHIGEIVEDGVKIKDRDGKISPLPPRGYDHFKQDSC